MTIKTIEKKVRARTYRSLSYATAAIKRSALNKADQKTMMSLAETVYATKPDRLEETADIGKPLVVPLGPVSTDLEKELMRLALRAHYVMGQHGLSREQLFDRLKETMIA